MSEKGHGITHRETGLVTVVIPTKDSGKHLDRVLSSVDAQTYPEIQVIVIDNFSRDETPVIARKHSCLFVQKGPERSAQINHGARLAKGEYLFRGASDLLLPPSIIDEGVKLIRQRRCDMVEFPWLPDPSISFWAKVRYADLWTYVEDAKPLGPSFFRTADFLSLGGNDETLVAGEDYEFRERVAKAGFKVGMSRGIMVHLGEPKHLSEVVRKDVYYGKHLRDYAKAGGSSAEFSPARGRYWRHRDAFLRRGPAVTFGFALYEGVRYASAAIGMMLG